MKDLFLKALVGALLITMVTLIVLPVYAQGPTTEQIQAWLMRPAVLYVLMLLGSIVSMVKQWGVSKMSGGSTTIAQYASHGQELITTLFGNSVAFAGLIMTDSLNFVSALSIGYVISSLSDLNPAGSRSTALESKKGE
jgi:hypothetical protein